MERAWIRGDKGYSKRWREAAETRREGSRAESIARFMEKVREDLNPIEFIWKSAKRGRALSFVRVLEDLKCIISEKFEEFSSKTYAGGWIKRFLVGWDICNGLCD